MRLREVGMCLAAVSVLWFSGCGSGSDPGRTDTVAVTGTVTYQGAPVEGATVTFQPQSPATVPGQGTTQPAAFGTTDAEGHFTLVTPPAASGAVPGMYQVTVVKMDAPPTPPAEPADSANYVPPKEGKPTPPPKNLLPKKYSQPGTSGLTATVTDDPGKNDFKFDLSA